MEICNKLINICDLAFKVLIVFVPAGKGQFQHPLLLHSLGDNIPLEKIRSIFSRLTFQNRAVVVAQLVERLLPIPEDRSSNPVISKILY